MESLVVTVVGPDRPGLVSLLSDCGRAHGASWEESRMASLAGQFAGIVHFAVPPEQKAALTAALHALRTVGLEAVVVAGVAAAGSAEGRLLRLELVGQDRPGIIRDVSGAVAELGVSIRELTTEMSSAAMSGEH
ncbi:MAG: ACT domain-containing protein, partial [Betaproteobacteria bacterium]